jgi:DNA repair photolyase
MIISASRRTDIPAFWGDWFMECLRAGEVFVTNPVNRTQVSRVSLAPEQVDCIVFWTKNPAGFLRHLDELDRRGYRYYFQFTLTPYGRDIEPNLPEKSALLAAFCELSDRIGKERVMWRYDPILLNPAYTLRYHAEQFEQFAAALSGKTEKCVISFIDTYGFLKKTFAELGIREPELDEMRGLAGLLRPLARNYGLSLASCCEKVDLSPYGIGKNKCVDDELIKRLFGLDLRYKKDPGQRGECCCMVSRDIGSYRSCLHGCRYCYAARP